MSIKRQSNGSENSSTSGWAVPCAIVRDSPLLEPVYSKQRNGFDFDWIALEKGTPSELSTAHKQNENEPRY